MLSNFLGLGFMLCCSRYTNEKKEHKNEFKITLYE
nr:hypothetical protein [Enterococcus faecium]